MWAVKSRGKASNGKLNATSQFLHQYVRNGLTNINPITPISSVTCGNRNREKSRGIKMISVLALVGVLGQRPAGNNLKVNLSIRGAGGNTVNLFQSIGLTHSRGARENCGQSIAQIGESEKS
eukprot:sb/3475964/